MTTTPYAPGVRILVRDEEWLVRTAKPIRAESTMVKAVGVSELVRDTEARTSQMRSGSAD